MSDIFISYSRKDSEFVKKLHAATLALQRDVWVDFEDIPLSADWWSEINSNIESADTFVFVISPDSLASPICHFELDHAVQYNKRLVPIVRVMTDEKAMIEALSKRSLDENMKKTLGDRDLLVVARTNWQAIARHNWLFFQDDAGFDANFQKLILAIDTDLSHVRRHTRLLVKSREWEERGKLPAYLLNSGEISEYSGWVRESASKEPRPTELQLEYLFVSQRAANRRQAITYISMMVALVITGVLIAFAYVQNQRIQEGELTRIAFERQNAEQRATAAAQAIILTEQRATGEANLLLVTAQVATNIARQTAVSQDLDERILTAQAGFIGLTQQAQGQSTATAVAATFDALVIANTQVVATLNFFELFATRVAQQANPPTREFVEEPTQTAYAPELATSSDIDAIPTDIPSIELATALVAVPTVEPPIMILTPSLTPTSEMALAGVYYVNSDNGSDSNPCNTSNAPCQTINAALAKATSGATINVDYGIYDENVFVSQSVILQGANRDLTILNGGQRDSAIVVQSGGRLDLRNLTVTGGNSAVAGGGIRNEGTLITRNIALTGNSSAGVGGGLANLGNAAMINTTISNNIGSNGGGVYIGYNAQYATDNQTSNTNNTASSNLDTNNQYQETCPTAVREAYLSAINECSDTEPNEACLIAPTVTVIDGDSEPFGNAGDTINLDTVTELQFSQNSTVLINSSPIPIVDTPQTSFLYVRGALPVDWLDEDIAIGSQALTTPGFADALNIRTEPSTSADIVTGVYSGLVVNVLDGPQEAEGYTWWYLRLPNGSAGWAVESVDDESTLEAITVDQTTDVGGRYTIYGAGSRGLNLRTAPSPSAEMVTTVQQGRDVIVLDGPIDAEGFRWWFVVTTLTNEQGWVISESEGEKTLLPVVTQRLGVPEAYSLSTTTCSAITDNPIRFDSTNGIMRIGLSNVGDE